jgi:sulfur-oxidizing protein SoxY
MTEAPRFNRRTFLRLVGGGLAVLTVRPVAALAQDGGIDVPDVIRPYLTEAFGDWQLERGRIELDMPVIAETGLSVPTSFMVASPMTPDDHVQRIMAFAPGNPEHVLADYIIGPRAGRAAISTRVRIARSQIIIAAAQMSDGTRWGTTFDMTVTRGACVDEIFLPDLRALEERERARAEAAAAAAGE